jgi:effector-binding domain-containing protein
MEILEARPHEYLKMEMRMGEMEPSEVEWFFRENNEGTEVEWTLVSGDLPFMVRAIMAATGGQSTIENSYNEGLAAIAEIAEAKPKVTAPDITVVQEVMPAMTYMGKRYDDVTMEAVQAGTMQGEAFGALMQAIGGPQNMTGAPMCIIHRYDDETQNMDLEYALPIAETMEGSDDMSTATLPEQKVAYYDYMGPYEGLGQAWEEMGMWLAANGMEVAGAPYEVYVTDPGTEPDPSKWITRIVYPVQ